MSKKFGAIALVALLALGFIASGAFAAEEETQARTMQGPGVHGFGNGYGDDIQTIIETGTYQDLVDLREETGLDLMPHIDSEDDFEAIQEEAQDRTRLRTYIEDVLESGTYEELVALREEFGKNIMPWVDSDDELDQAREMEMNGFGPKGKGMGGIDGMDGKRAGAGMRHKYDGDCPYADDTAETTE